MPINFTKYDDEPNSLYRKVFSFDIPVVIENIPITPPPLVTKTMTKEAAKLNKNQLEFLRRRNGGGLKKI